MVRTQLIPRGIDDPRVLAAFRRVPRHLFLPEEDQRYAYDDRALAIGAGQTISQPYMVAATLQLARPRRGACTLEIGTGYGYQAALLWELTGDVDTIERIGSLAREARRRLDQAGYDEVRVHHRDGTLGLPERAPFDVIVVAAGAERAPDALLQQLAERGRLVIPLGSWDRMRLTLFERFGEEFRKREDESCVFVPLLGGVDD